MLHYMRLKVKCVIYAELAALNKKNNNKKQLMIFQSDFQFVC